MNVTVNCSGESPKEITMNAVTINQSTPTETAIINANIDTEQVVIRTSRNEDWKGDIVLVMSYAEALTLAKAIIAQSYDAHIDAIAPDPDWRHMMGSVD